MFNPVLGSSWPSRVRVLAGEPQCAEWWHWSPQPSGEGRWDLEG